MTEEVKRGRGRPRKEVVATAPAAPVMPTEAPLDPLAAQLQIATQIQALGNLAKAMGIDMAALLGITPPRGTVEGGTLAPADTNSGGKFTVREWHRGKYDPTDKVTFTPHAIPGMVFPLTDEDGYQKILLQVNDVPCWLTVGEPNTVSRMFYQVYKDQETEWKSVEILKRQGPKGKPWGERTHQGEPTWKFVASAPSYGMDVNGRWLPNSNTVSSDMYPPTEAPAQP